MDRSRLTAEPELAFRQPGRLHPVRLGSALAGLCLAAFLAACTSTTDPYDVFTMTDVTPRLQNNEPERRGPVINEAAFNSAAVNRTMAPYAGYVGSMRVSYEGDRAAIERDLNELGQVAPPRFNPNEMVTIDFTNASLDFILRQLLGGALGINYVAPEGLPRGINFRTETPVPKSRVIQVVRDLLSRNNLVLRFVNGVYHIGPREMIESMEANSSVGRSGDDAVRIVKLERGNANQVATLAAQLLPPNVSVMATSASDTVVLRANPNDLDSIERLLRTLSVSAVGSDRVAIIPLSRSAPEAVAAQLTEFYAPTLREGEGRVTAIPLQNQQAILVGTSDPSLMEGLMQLARQLDRSVTDVSELRVIALTHLRAADIAPHLSQLFGSTVAPPPAEAAGEGARDPRETTGVRARLRAPRPQPDSEADNPDGTGLNVSAPPMPPPAAGGGGEAREPTPPAAAAVMPSPQAGETRIVADERTNTILVYSTYSVYKRMREVVQTLDVAQAQVVIEATVLEVALTDALEAGVQFFLRHRGIVIGSGVPSGNQAPYSGGIIGISSTVGNTSIDAVLRALNEITNVKVVSSPYLTVVDGQSARLVIGDQIPFATTSQTSNNQGSVTVTQNIEILDTGVVLEITPRIHANNAVTLNIVQSVSTPAPSAQSGNLTPVIATRDISSQILAQSGRTILLGGMIQDRIQKQEDGVPGAMRVPVLGSLFKQHRSTLQRTELLVLITPRVVRSSGEIEAITRMLQGVQWDPKSR